MPTIVPPTFDELFAGFRRRMEALGFTHWSQGSRIGAIGRTISGYLLDLWHALSAVEEQINPSTATGVYLDRIGEQFGVRRVPPLYASTLGKGAAIKFTNNGAGSTTIPANTRVWNPDDPDVAFWTVNALTLGAGNEGYVDVVAGAAGERHNVGTGTLTAHNAGMGQISVTNVRPVGGGALTESDASYRFRITESMQSRGGGTEGAIRQALLQLPGVRDALVQSGVRGNGSVDVVVVPVDRYLSSSLKAAAESAVSRIVAAGISYRVRGPITRRVDLQIQLRLGNGATLAEVRPAVESAVRGYLDNRRVNDGRGGSDLVFYELVSRVQDAHPDIVDSAISYSVDGRPSLNTNLQTSAGERLVSGALSIV